MKQQFIIDDELFGPLERWTKLCYENDWVDVPKPKTGYEEPDFVLITDASKLGWAALLISMKGGQTTVVSGIWPPDYEVLAGSSAETEPLAVWAAVSTLFARNAKASIAHGDNIGNRSEMTRGYSTKPGHVVQGLLREQFPNITFSSSTYCPGTDIPADGPSRQQPLDEEKLRSFCAARGITLGTIRDQTVRNPLDLRINQAAS